MRAQSWDYLILTAANETQADVYRTQLDLRRRLGLLGAFGQTLVVADPGGKRVGSGGSTIFCLGEILGHARGSNVDAIHGAEGWTRILRGLRILIIHAGGDSRRLPAYGPCGKVFMPLPNHSDSAISSTVFDCQLPVYAALPTPLGEDGQVVITSGDVLLEFSPDEVHFEDCGITGLGCRAAPERASRHGVYCVDADNHVRRFLQKPSVETQAEQGAIDRYGDSVLDIGVIHFDAQTAATLLQLGGLASWLNAGPTWTGEVARGIKQYGLDFYREICCALGAETTFSQYLEGLRASGSKWPEDLLRQIFAAVSRIPTHTCVLNRCSFLHFGTTQEIIASGRRLAAQEQALDDGEACLNINNQLAAEVALPSTAGWIEGCRIQQGVSLSGQNVLVGVDVSESLRLPPRACLDVLPGRSREGEPVSFIRCYHQDDAFHNTPPDRLTLCATPLSQWLASAEVEEDVVWPSDLPAAARNGWNARLFPAEPAPDGYRHWIWMLEPAEASGVEFQAWAAADRYSLEEMLILADRKMFNARRAQARAEEMRRSLRQYFRVESGFSAADLAYLLETSSDPSQWLCTLINEARWQYEDADPNDHRRAFAFCRVIHSLGSALAQVPALSGHTLRDLLDHRATKVSATDTEWLEGIGLPPDTGIEDWASRARSRAFEHLRRQIIRTDAPAPVPRNALRPDEIVWGRAPARLDLTGGWTDTPPFSLENGGCVINAAVHLNGQPPIQAYVRVTQEPSIRIRSIDVGSDLEIGHWAELLDYGTVTSQFALVKAALAISGFSPTDAHGEGNSLQELLTHFGGGLEVTTLAAVPKGSGLGTSSIMGAVLMAVIQRTLGRTLSQTELFHAVLRLEQALTTGGGWQDQIGGAVGGLKLITTAPGMTPEAAIRYVPPEVLDPGSNNGCTLLYYTGITRLAKNILEQVVGRYLDRDRERLATLHALHDLAHDTADVVARKDYAKFGRMIDRAWQLNKRLDPDSTNERVEAILSKARPFIYGAKLLGAGGGGFLLMVCKSPRDAVLVQEVLTAEPPNDRARFFDFAVSETGLEVSVC